MFNIRFSPDCGSPRPDCRAGRRGGEHVAPRRGPGPGPGQVLPGAGWILLGLQTPHTNVCQGQWPPSIRHPLYVYRECN